MYVQKNKLYECIKAYQSKNFDFEYYLSLNQKNLNGILSYFTK